MTEAHSHKGTNGYWDWGHLSVACSFSLSRQEQHTMIWRTSVAMVVVVKADLRWGMLERPTPRLSKSSTLTAV